MADKDEKHRGKPDDKAAAFKDGKKPGPADSETQVRPAGPESQKNPPKKWDKVDEAADESFPASDQMSPTTGGSPRTGKSQTGPDAVHDR